MKKLSFSDLESKFPVLDPEISGTIKGGLSVLDIIEAINRGDSSVYDCTFNFQNGECTSILYQGNYIDIRTFSLKDDLSDYGGGGNDGEECGDAGCGIPSVNPSAFTVSLPEVTVNGRRPNYFTTLSDQQYNPFRYGAMDLSDYYHVLDPSQYAGAADSASNYNMRAALNYIQSLADSHTPYRQEYGRLRTSDSADALAYMDCSELVCRYFAKMGFISTNVLPMNSLAIRQYAEQHPGMLPRVPNGVSPQQGDIFLWHRSDTDGHTGIVKSYDPSTDMVTILEEYSYGDIHEAREVEYRLTSGALTKHDGWEGFYRPNVN